MMDISFGSDNILLLFTFVKVPSFVIFCFVIGALGLGVFFGMGGCLHLLELVRFLLGLLRMMMLLLLGWRGCSVLTLRTIVENGFLPIISLTVLLLLMFLITLTYGLMVVLFLMSCQVLGLEVVACTLLSLVLVGSIAGGEHLELLVPSELGVERCILFDSVRGPLQSVQRAELWGVILALQCSSAVHLGVDNLNVVRHVSDFGRSCSFSALWAYF